MPHPNSKTKDSILQWIPQTATNLTVINSPFTYYNGNSQPIDPESGFELVCVRPIFWPPEGASWEESSWLKSSDIARIAYIDNAAPHFPDRMYLAIGFLRSNEKLETDIVSCMRHAAKKEISMYRTPVFFFESKAYEGVPPTKEYRSLVAPGILVSSNCREYLAHVLQQRDNGNTLKPNLTEWEGLDTLSSYWGFRQFDKAERERLKDKRALGYNFEYDKASQQLDFRYFTYGSVLPKIGASRLAMSEEISSHTTRANTSDANIIELKTKPTNEMGNMSLFWIGPLAGGIAGKHYDSCEERESQ